MNDHRVPIDDDIEDALHRMLESSQDMQRRIFRISRRNFITEAAVGQLGYTVDAVCSELQALKDRLPKQ